MLGAPFVGNTQTAIFYPLNWIYFAWPSGAVNVIHAWLSLVLAALGTYLLARQVLRVGPLGSIIASITYAFGSFMSVWLMFTLADTAVWIPWLWWATGRLVAEPSARKVAAMAIVAALSVFAGHAETTFHAGFVTAPFAVFEAVRSNRWQPGRITRVLLLWAGAYVLGAALSAVQILPFAEYTLNSAALRTRSNTAETEWFPTYYAWTLFSPRLFGTPAPPSNWWGSVLNYNEVNNYCGLLALVLAPFAILARGRRQLWIGLFLLGMIVTCMGMYHKWPIFYEIANRLPILRLERNGRLIAVVQLSLGLIAALGLDGIWHTAARRWWRVALCLGGAALAVLTVGILVPTLKMHEYFQVPTDNPGVMKTWQDALARSSWLLLAYVAVLLAAVILWTRRRQWGRAALIFLPLVLMFDMLDAHVGYNPTLPGNHYFPPTPETQFLQQQGLSRFIAAGLVLPPNTNLMYEGLADFRGYDTLMPASYQELGSQIDGQVDVGGPRYLGNIRSRLLNFLNIRYLLVPPGDTRNADVPEEGWDAYQDTYVRGIEGTVGPIAGDVRPGQTFKVQRDGLHQVTVLGATYGRTNAGQLVFHLKEAPDSPVDLATVTLEAAELSDNSRWEFNFPAIERSAGRSFYFFIEALGTTQDKAVTVYFSPTEQYPDGSRFSNGQPAEGDLVFSASTQPDRSDPAIVRVQDGSPNRISILENRRVLPRAWLTHGVEVQPDTQLRLRRLQELSFDPATTVMLNQPLPAEMPLPPGAPVGGADTVRIVSYEAERVEIESSSSAAGMLVLADQDFPGWNAYIGNQQVPVFTANHAIRAVYLPPGRHIVRFEYQPLWFQVGAALTLASVLTVCLLFAWPLLSRRRKGAGKQL
jgi:hypothetical protein